MLQQILPIIIEVNKQGSRVYFPVLLPKDTAAIEKIQTSVRIKDVVNTQAGIAGKLQLQASGRPNICYSTDVKTDATFVAMQILGFSGGSDVPASGKTSPIVDFMRQPFFAQQKQSPESLHICGNTQLYGCYRDELGLFNQVDVVYTVSLFLHLILKN